MSFLIRPAFSSKLLKFSYVSKHASRSLPKQVIQTASISTSVKTNGKYA